jgi:predicted glycoside hydrolase/deacetylase ChbG (UPF0249 family)
VKGLIITADDYGMSPAVNQAINEGIECGLVTSTNVMVGMDYAEDAFLLRQKYPYVSVGIHWTLTAGKPVTRPEDIPSLVDSNGKFYNYRDFRKRYRNNNIKEDEIFIELKNQYDRFCKLCGKPDYWNTHQNVHVEFRLYRFFVKCAKALGINKMRSHQRVYIKPKDGKLTVPMKWILLEPVKLLIINHWKRVSLRSGIVSPDGIVTFFNEEDKLDLDYVFSSLNNRNAGFAEYVIHPAVRIDSEYFGSISEDRIIEYKLFTSNDTKYLVNNKNFKLVNFKDI